MLTDTRWSEEPEIILMHVSALLIEYCGKTRVAQSRPCEEGEARNVSASTMMNVTGAHSRGLYSELCWSFRAFFSAGRVYVSSENIGLWLTVMSKFSSCPFPRCLCCHGYIIICESSGWAFCRTPWYDVDPSKEDLIAVHTMKESWKICSRMFSVIILLMRVMNRENSDRIHHMLILIFLNGCD